MQLIALRGIVLQRRLASCGEMEGSFENPSFLSRLIRVVNVLGTSFTSVRSVVNGVFRFVNGNRLKSLESNEANGNDGMAAMRLGGGEADSLSSFSTFIDNMNFVYPDIFSGRDSFNVFYEFCVAENLAYGAVFVSNRETCRICNGNPTIVGGSKDVIVYHMTRGTYLGSRFTKQCRKCKLQEHYGFSNHRGKRIFDQDCLEKEFLLSTEETAIDIKLLKYLDEEIVHGALPFQVKAKVYNSVHSYSNEKDEDEIDESEKPCNAKKRR